MDNVAMVANAALDLSNIFDEVLDFFDLEGWMDLALLDAGRET